MSESEKVDVSVRLSMSEDQCNALLRFNDACEDGQPYDVRRPMMMSLACVGMVRWCGRSIFEITDAGIAVVEELQERAK